MAVSLAVLAGRPVGRALLDPLVDGGHAVAQPGDRAPAQVALGPPDGQGAALELARPARRERRLDRAAGGSADHPCQVQDADLLAGADVPGTGAAPVGGEQERRDRVPDVDVVAGLAAVAVDDGALAGQEPGAEDRDDPRLPRRVLARAVHVGQPQHRVGGAVQPVVEADILLGAQLGDAVRRLGQREHVLGGRDRRVLAVQGAAGGAEQHPRADGPGGLQHVHRADDIGLRVGGGCGDAGPYVNLGGQVTDERGAQVAGDGRQRAGRGDAQLVRGRGAGEPAGPAGAEVIHDGDLVTPGQQGVSQVGPDEPRTAGNQYAHGCAVYEPGGLRAGGAARRAARIATMARELAKPRDRITYASAVRQYG